jgi:hypothetical protein
LSGKAAQPRELLRGHSLVVLASVDNRFLFLRDSAPPPDELVPSEAKRRLDWSVFSLEKSQIVARVPHVPGTQSAILLGERAYFLVAGPVLGRIDQGGARACSIHAIDVKTGKGSWERPIAGKSLSPPGRK